MMAEAVCYGVVCVANGRVAEVGKLPETQAEALEVVKGLLAGLGVHGGGWVRLAPGCAVLHGSEHGGWAIVLYRGLVKAAGVPAKRAPRAKAAPETRYVAVPPAGRAQAQ